MQYTLNSVFDHIYILNLKEDKDKYINTQKQLAEYNIKAERFEAINGNNFKKEFEKNKKKGGSGGLYRSYGAYGRLLSQIKIIEDAIIKKYKNILILEDDILLHKNFDIYFDRYYKKIKNKKWKFIMLGSSLNTKRISKIDKILFKIKKKIYIHVNKSCYGGFAIGIANSMYFDLLKKYKDFTYPNDNCNNRVAYKLYKKESFVFKPDLIIADLSESKTFKKRSYNTASKKLKSYNWDITKYNSKLF
jgi:GR25 family glycosyltransferase involved in LPS biosynthesis